MSERLANLALVESADARIDAIIREKIKAMRKARRAQRQAPKLGAMLAGQASLREYFAVVNGR